MTDKHEDAMDKLVRDDLEKNDGTKSAAENPADQVVKSADRQLHRAQRFVLVYNIVCIIAMFVAICSLFHTTSIKWMVLYAIIFLVCFETTILMKLWYWVVNVKCTLARDMKLMRLDMAKATGIESSYSDEPWFVTAYINKQFLWRFFLAFWVGVIVLLGPKYDQMYNPIQLDCNNNAMACRRTVMIDKSGEGNMQSEYSFPNLGMFPIDNFSFVSGRVPNKPLDKLVLIYYTTWTNDPISSDVEPDGPDHYKTKLSLKEPVMPGERLTFRSYNPTYELPENCLAEKDGIWTWTDGQSWDGYPECRYDYTVILDPDVELVDASPEANQVGKTEDGATKITYHIITGQNEPMQVKVRYRLKDDH